MSPLFAYLATWFTVQLSIFAEYIAPRPGVLADTVVFGCVYPAPFSIITIDTIFPPDTTAFALAPIPSPLIVMSGVLKKSLPPYLIMI